MRKSHILTLTAIVCVPVAASGQLPIDWLGSERGSFATGVAQEIWVDESRDEPATADADDKRRLSIKIWYPAEASDVSQHATYAPEIDDYDQWTQDNWGLAASRQTASVRAAELSEAQAEYPVLLYSPGFGNPAFTGTYQTEYLASHGYVVVAIGHTGWDARVRFPDGTTIEALQPDPEVSGEEPAEPDEERPPIELYRAAAKDSFMQMRRDLALEDISFVIDELERLDGSRDSRFYERLDLDGIGGFGFSIGGADYFEATVTEPRISAAVNLDGGLSGHTVLRNGARKPILLIQASDSFPRVVDGEADAGMEEFFTEVEREIWQMLRLSSHEWYKATISGTEHPHFSDAFLIVPAPENMTDPKRVHYLANRLTLEFFDRHLRGSQETPVLDHRETLDGLHLVTKLSPQPRGR